MRPVAVVLAALCAIPLIAQDAATRAQLQAELDKLTAELPSITRPGASTAVRRDYVERVLKLRERLAALPPPRMVLYSIKRGDQAIQTLGEHIEAEYDLSPEAGPPLRVRYTLATAFQIPREIEPGKNFSLGICSASAIVHGSQQPATGRALEHQTGIRVTASTIYSFQQIRLAPAAGAIASGTQQAVIRYVYDPDRSRPPGLYFYRSQLQGQGETLDAPRPPSSYWLELGTAPLTEEGLLGAATTRAAIKSVVVSLENNLHAIRDGRLVSSGPRESHHWTVEYRLLDPGERAPTFSDLPGGAPGACPAVVTPSTPAPPATEVTSTQPPADTQVEVANVQGRKADEAARMLAGLQVRPRIGQPAPSAAEEYTVISQRPAPGQRVARGEVVELTVYGPAPLATNRATPPPPAGSGGVPNVEGRPAREAREELERAGFRVRPEVGPPAPSAAEVNQVKSQVPPAGTRLAAGSEVRIVILGPAASTVAEGQSRTSQPPVQARRTPTSFTMPPPPRRILRCPQVGGNWRPQQPSVIGITSEGTSSARCVYLHTANQYGPVELFMNWGESGYPGYQNCDARLGVRVYAGVAPVRETRRLDQAYVLGQSEAPSTALQEVAQARPALLAQISPYADRCTPLPAPMMCDDDPRCAIPCPAVDGFVPTEPIVVPEFRISDDGSRFAKTCDYKLPTGRNLVVSFSYDWEGRRFAAERCAVDTVVRGSAGPFGGTASITLSGRDKRLKVWTSLGAEPGGPPQDRIDAAKQIVAEVFRVIEPRVARVCP